ncbi:hypothetical protein [Nonomuraea sp. KM90]|uniref:hypothetical protein n=1 Tax=Nonomuraea sp. KM90 TaxID=3457428 RepID=UPI003FCE34B5
MRGQRDRVGGVTGRYLVRADGLRVEPVTLTAGSPHWLFARMREPDAQLGEVWYKVTAPAGHAIDVPGYYQLHELQEIVDLADLREVDDVGGEETA